MTFILTTQNCFPLIPVDMVKAGAGSGRGR
jgi:hypothetical protein